MCREEAGASTPQAASTITVAGTERCNGNAITATTLMVGESAEADGTIRCDDDNVHDATLATAPLADLAAEMRSLGARHDVIMAELDKRWAAHRKAAPAERSFTYPCWVNDEPCPVVAAIEPAIIQALADNQAHRNAPYLERAPYPFDIEHGLRFYLACGKCPRPAQAHLTELVGLRLGGHGPQPGVTIEVWPARAGETP